MFLLRQSENCVEVNIWALDRRRNRGCRRLHNEGVLWNLLFTIFLSVYQIIKNALGGSCSTYGNQDLCMYSFGRYNLFKGITFNSKRRRENIIKFYLQDVECGCMDWIERSFGFYKLRIVL
jgi:hypothetical protein